MGQIQQLSNARRVSVDTGVHSSLPIERYAPMHPPTPARPPRPARLQLILGIGIPAMLALIVAVVLVVNNAGSGPTPNPISQDELVAEYSELAPGDSTATPASIKQLANEACDQLDNSVSPSELTSSVADAYHGRDRAEKVLHLLVSYGCPEHINAFE